MATFATLLEPSANFSLPFVRVVYAPAGLAYAFSPLLAQWFVIFKLIFAAYFLHLAYGIVFFGTIFWMHKRLCVIKMATTHHQKHTSTNIKLVSGILRNIMLALTTTSQYTQESLIYLACFLETAIAELGAENASNIDELAAIFDDDIDKVYARLNLQGKMLLCIENNVDQARYILADMASHVGTDDGMVVGDEAGKFWTEESQDGSEGLGETPKEVVIDVEACNQQVWWWLENCAEPEDVEDIFEEL